MQFARAENTFLLVLWNTPALNRFHKVGRALVPVVPGVQFPSDLLRNAKCESPPEMTRFIDVLPTGLQGTEHFHLII